jgi:hypothetical protein
MGILLVLLGIGAAGVIADFAIENDLTTAPDQSFEFAGRTFNMSTPELVVTAAVLAAVAVVFVVLGMGLIRGSWGRRRALKGRIAQLERENLQLESKAHLSSTLGQDRTGGDAPASPSTS